MLLLLLGLTDKGKWICNLFFDLFAFRLRRIGLIESLLQPIRSTTQMREVIHHQYGNFFVAPWMSFCRETNSGVAKCYLFCQATINTKSCVKCQNNLERWGHNMIAFAPWLWLRWHDFKPWSMDLLFSVRQKVFSRKRPLLKNLLLSSGNGGPCGSKCIWYDYFKITAT